MLNQIKKFAIVSLGCKVNRAESDSYAAFLISQNASISTVQEADLVIVNTCTVTSIADKKTRQAVRKVCKQTKASIIIVTGCAAAINKDTYEAIDKRIEVVSKIDVDNKIKSLCQNNNVSNGDIAKILASQKFRTRASLKIQDGCNNSCTYCIVCKARGNLWSLSHNVVINRVQTMIDAGIKEIVLSGVNIGAYNDNGFVLEDLCVGLLDVIGNNNARIRISSIEPNNISDKLIDIIANADGKICRHLHLPLQSGSSKVLKEMNRHYDSEKYLEIVNKLKHKIPNIALSTDIIVGFPGETETDFQQTLDMANKCSFMKIHVFPYSKREGTIAASRHDQTPQNIKEKRAAILRKLSDDLAIKDLENRKGSNEFVLVENYQFARTESYHKVKSPKNAKVGDLINVEL